MDDTAILSMISADKQAVGAALAEYRRRHDKTLQEISQMTGISIGTLSKLENNKATPSFDTLRRIVQSLNLSHPERQQPNRTLPATGRKSSTLLGDTVINETDHAIMHIHAADLLNKDMFPMTAQIKLHAVPPFEEWTSHAGEEFVCVIRGAIEVHVEHYAPFVLNEGESAYYDSGMKHVIVSLGEEDAFVVSVSSGRRTDERSDDLVL